MKIAKFQIFGKLLDVIKYYLQFFTTMKQDINQRDFTERVKKIIEVNCITPSKLKGEAGISNITRKMDLSNTKYVWTINDVKLLCNRYGISREWLLKGIGSMYLGNNTQGSSYNTDDIVALERNDIIETSSRKKRLDDAIKHLISIGLIDGKKPSKSIALTMDRNRSNISSTLRGDSRYLNRNFIRDFCATYKNIISADWIWEGAGEMIINDYSEMEEKNRISLIPEDKLMNLTKEELISLARQLMELNKEQNDMYNLLIQQNERMIRYGHDRFNNIMNLIFKNV